MLDNGVTAAEQFLINRLPRQRGDRFQIPNSVCQSISSVPKCAEYNAIESGSECQCQCPSAMASLLYNENKWKCTDDKTIRQEESKYFQAAKVVLAVHMLNIKTDFVQ